VHGDARARARTNANPEMPQLHLSAFLEPQVPPLGMPHARCVGINRIYYSKSINIPLCIHFYEERKYASFSYRSGSDFLYYSTLHSFL